MRFLRRDRSVPGDGDGTSGAPGRDCFVAKPAPRNDKSGVILGMVRSRAWRIAFAAVGLVAFSGGLIFAATDKINPFGVWVSGVQKAYIDSSGNFEANGTITAGSADTQVTDSVGKVRDAALSSNVPLKDATNTFTGANTFSGTAPTLTLTETDGATNQKNWRWVADGGQLKLKLFSDDLSTNTDLVTYGRTGTTPTTTTIDSALSVNPSLTTGRNVTFGAVGKANGFQFNGTTGKTGINALPNRLALANPEGNIFEIDTDGMQNRVALRQFGDQADGPAVLGFSYANGTRASPTPIVNGDEFAAFDFGAYVGGGSADFPVSWDPVAMRVEATSDVSSGHFTAQVRWALSDSLGTFNNVFFIKPTGLAVVGDIDIAGRMLSGYWRGVPVEMAYGGTNAALTASNGGIFYSTASAGAILSGTATANKMLLSGSSAAPSWSTSTIPSSAGATANKVLLSDGTNYVLSTPTFPNASATALKHIRSDGTNWIATTATISDSPGTAGKVLTSDGTNWVTSTPTFPNASATSGKFIRSDGTNWVASTPTLPTSAGTSLKHLRSDGTNYVESTPTFSETMTSGAYMRSDGTNWITSTLILPNSATATRIPFASAANTWSDSANLTFDSSSNAFVVTGSAAVSGSATFSGAVSMSPANANVNMSPTGTGVVTINPATVGTMDNVVIGGTTAAAATVTTITASGAATLNGGAAVTGNVTFDGQSGRSISENRNTTSNTAGNSLTVAAGGATSGATDKAGGDVIISPGVPTGLGNGSSANMVRLRTYAPALATGTTDGTLINRMMWGRVKSLTNNTATQFATAANPTLTVANVKVNYGVAVTDGTDVQGEVGVVTFQSVNKGGTFTQTVTKDISHQNATAGTLTVTFTMTGTDPSSIRVNCNSSLTPSTGYPRISVSIENLSDQNTVTPAS